ncbi:hypothetical protein EGI22_07790 [Lacihabitans sp. LS3-19]|uniref:lipocalin family protein n=1 Tax=Lacihabitans sp. LS3-19 TaxID=2487335 RepID=UPI0020CDBF87|nr:DUF5004 domain-containing protein [Lacihabitans sp. LS3-19]MCP9767810.1 hypothetical protein [Lacihabitans sp. LS3-19]
MKSLKSSVLVIFFGVLVGLTGCKKEDVGPNAKIAGTWKITSANYKDSSQAFDIWALYNAFYPCTKDITMTFTEDNKYSVFEPNDCKDDNGESLFIFTPTGTFNLTNDTALDIIESDATPYNGNVVFEDGKFTWTYEETFEGELSSLVVVFTKVK